MTIRLRFSLIAITAAVLSAVPIGSARVAPAVSRPQAAGFVAPAGIHEADRAGDLTAVQALIE